MKGIETNAFERSVSKASKTLPLFTEIFPFPTLPESSIEYYLFENFIVDSKKKVTEKSKHLTVFKTFFIKLAEYLLAYNFLLYL